VRAAEEAPHSHTSGAAFRFFSLACAVSFLNRLPNDTELIHATRRAVSDTVPYSLHSEVAFKWSFFDTGVLEAGKNAQFLSGNLSVPMFEAISSVQKKACF
jgi:hypothetical protein